MNKKRWFIVASTVIVLAVALVWYATRADATKTGVVKEIHNTSGDSCSYLELDNGDRVNTFCFWAQPDKQPDYDTSIKVGDVVEYGVGSNRQFVRLK